MIEKLAQNAHSLVIMGWILSMFGGMGVGVTLVSKNMTAGIVSAVVLIAGTFLMVISLSKINKIVETINGHLDGLITAGNEAVRRKTRS